MIRKLTRKDNLSIYEFVSRVSNTYQDFYITKDKQRVFLTDRKLIDKILRYQDVYAVDDAGTFRAILLVYREKGFRPYIRILAEKNNYIYDLLKFLNWQYNCEFFIKVKKTNPIAKICQRFFWEFCGNRGEEILFVHKRWEKKHDNHYIKA